MCGITGIWNLNHRRVDIDSMVFFNNTLNHRGPDGGDIYLDEKENLGLGHRRLSILDLSAAGNQPMYDVTGDLIIVFNGEIFNYVELREELRTKGYPFKTRSDTEVILAAYKEWGEDCLLKFNGMWAFAIWNKRKKELFISRDRFGIKPLYFVSIPRKLFAFSSESISFGSLPNFNKSFSSKNLNLGIRYPFYLESIGESIYENIIKLKPGHSLTIRGDNSKVIQKKWWDTNKHLVIIPNSYQDQIEQFRELLLDACKIRLRSDVTIGSALSGGLDSSSVYCTIQQLNKRNLLDNANMPPEWQTAYIASFPETSMDEKPYADEIIEYTNGKAKYIYPDNINLATQIVDEVLAEDFIYLSPPVVHNIYKEMRKNGVKVSLDGHGVDEMLFGYPDMIGQFINNETDEENRILLYNILSGMLNKDDRQVRAEYGQGNKEITRSYLQSIYDNFVPKKVKYLYRKWSFQNRSKVSWMLDYFEAYAPHLNLKNNKPSYTIPYYNFHVDILPTLLRNWDRASMRHGVEIRMPFLDWRLVSFVFSLPTDSKIGNGFSKRILRDAMYEWMPEKVRTRKFKIGINAPMVEWFNGSLAEFLKDAVSSQSFIKSDIWNGPLLKDYVIQITTEGKWDQQRCNQFWPYINAWILQSKGR